MTSPLSKPDSPTPDFPATHLEREFKHTAGLITCRFDPTGNYLFATTEDYTILRWEVVGGKQTVFPTQDSWVGCLGFHPHDTVMYSGVYDGKLIAWQATAEAPTPLWSINAHRGWVRTLAVSPDGNTIATGGNDKTVRLWNTSDGSIVREFPGHSMDVYSLLFHSSGEFLLSGDLGGKVKQWDVRSGSEVRQFDASAMYIFNKGQGLNNGGVRNMALSPDGKQLACGGLYKDQSPTGPMFDPYVLLFDWETAAPSAQKDHVAKGDMKAMVWRTIYHPQGYLIGACGGTSGGFLLFWKPDKAEEEIRVALPNMLREADMHPDGLRIAAPHRDHTARIYLMRPKPAAG